MSRISHPKSQILGGLQYFVSSKKATTPRPAADTVLTHTGTYGQDLLPVCVPHQISAGGRRKDCTIGFNYHTSFCSLNLHLSERPRKEGLATFFYHLKGSLAVYWVSKFSTATQGASSIRTLPKRK